MNEPVEFKVTLDVSAASETHVTEFAIAHLRERGFSVTEPGIMSWETPGQFRARLQLNQKTFSNCLELWRMRFTGDVPLAVHVDRRGRSGRIKRLQSNAEFDEFCRREKARWQE
jgi:hypothetical protein